VASKVYIMATVIEMWFLHASPRVRSAWSGRLIKRCPRQMVGRNLHRNPITG